MNISEQNGQRDVITLGIAWQRRAENLAESLRWLVHLCHGVGKAGRAPEPGEWEEATEAGEVALAALCRCAGTGWVCEDHPDQPFDHPDCGGAGDPCLNCNPLVQL